MNLQKEVEKKQLSIKSTCQPPERLDFNTWARENNVSKIYDTGIFNDNLVYDEYVRKMKKSGLPNKNYRYNKLFKFLNKLKFND